jgi:putative membrane protein
MKKITTLAMIALAFHWTSCQNGGQTAENKDPMEQAEEMNETKNVNEEDAEFVTKAAETGMMEVELSKMALEKSSSQEVKTFAQHMVDEHTKNNAELKMLAESKQISVPVGLTEETRKEMDDLSKKSGADFDKEYMDRMVKDHKQAIDKFENASNSSKDGDIKNFAASTLPKLQEHHQMAEKTHETIKSRK